MSDLCRLLEAGPIGRSDTTQRGQRSLVDHRAVPGATGTYLVPRGTARRGARPLVAYHRLRPRGPRAARLAVAGAVGLGLGGIVGLRRVVRASSGAALLVDHLAGLLDEPRLAFAGSARPCRGFVTPVLQLLRPDGRTVAFAKLGWDVVTDAMVEAEAEALVRIAEHPVEGLSVPAVVWHGRWHGHAVLVTAPMPRDVRRRAARAPIPVAPLRALAAVDGPPARTPLRASGYWAAARGTADLAGSQGDRSLTARLDDLETTSGDAELEFGRWHGDWVDWNLAERGDVLHAWDWAYSGPSVPFGLDPLHHPYLRYRVVGRLDAEASARRALVDAAPALRALGLGSELDPVLMALLRLELDLRVVRAEQVRRGAIAEPRVP